MLKNLRKSIENHEKENLINEEITQGIIIELLLDILQKRGWMLLDDKYLPKSETENIQFRCDYDHTFTTCVKLLKEENFKCPECL